MMVDRELTRLAKDFPGIEVERIDILSHPLQAARDGIKMIPALKAGNRILSGIILTKKEIRHFLDEIA